MRQEEDPGRQAPGELAGDGGRWRGQTAEDPGRGGLFRELREGREERRDPKGYF